MFTHSERRYLAAKKTVDDRALNQHVVASLRARLGEPARELRVLEVGGGLGTMIARLIEWGLLRRGEYTLLDADEQSLRAAPEWLREWAQDAGVTCEPTDDGVHLRGGSWNVDVLVRLTCSQLGAYLAHEQSVRADLLVANAFLDLVEVPKVLPALLGLLAPHGHYWFSINFDGETLFQPPHELDDALMEAYHRTMDERLHEGEPAGESKCGRHMFGHLVQAGASIDAAGASDWVVHAPGGDYHADEAYFMEHILHTIEGALRSEPAVDAAGLADWLATRRAQLAAGTLVYIAHQLDFLGRRAATSQA